MGRRRKGGGTGRGWDTKKDESILLPMKIKMNMKRKDDDDDIQMLLKMRGYEDLHSFSENGLTALSTNHFLSRVGHGITRNYIWKLFLKKKKLNLNFSSFPVTPYNLNTGVGTDLFEIEVILQFSLFRQSSVMLVLSAAAEGRLG